MFKSLGHQLKCSLMKARSFKERFKQLCEVLINHCTTSYDHPEIDVLVKKGNANNQKRFVEI